jgi:hypothetical protein
LGKDKRFGERSWRARLTDEDVALIRALRDIDSATGLPACTFGQIAEKFDTPLSTIKGICWYKRR